VNKYILDHLIANVHKSTRFLDASSEFCDTTSLSEHFNDTHTLSSNLLDFDFDEFEFLILTDVIENLIFVEATNLIDKICTKDKLCLVGIKYKKELNKDIFLERHEQMRYLVGDEEYGYFINYEYIDHEKNIL
jgi:hypothetical protein